MSTLAASVRAIFEGHKDDFDRRVTTVEDAVTAILAGSLDEALLVAAQRDAHKLAGSLGTFGLSRGSELAAELERRFATGRRAAVPDDTRLGSIVMELRHELEAPALDRTKLEAGLTAEEPAGLTSGRILVVDDDMPVREALSAILSDAGYDVHCVSSAREARHALEHDTIALLLSDVSMPGETGLDLIRFALSEYPETATLLISALEDPGIAQVAMDYGAYGYLSKPVRRSAVLIGVMNALRRRTMEARERASRAQLERTVMQRTNALLQARERLAGEGERSGLLQAETIYRWAQAAEYRDPGIGGHVMRMSRHCALLGRKLGLHAGSLELASVLHDVGKSAIRDNVLLKRGPLTAAERLEIELHADIGAGMLGGSGSSVLDLAAVIARTHHEWFDGSGYPRGLSGADIPLEGRIAAVADVFDALTSDRAYRPAWSVPETIATMRSERATHFDPEVLDVFLASMDDVLAIRSALPAR